jgi:thiamine-phosphate pyrophosphorylase
VHVGQGDLKVSEVREIAPALSVGVSTHGLEQLALALDERPDYVAFGPVFPTRSKRNPDAVVGLEGLRQAKALCEKRSATTSRGLPMPLVAIGGIDVERAKKVAEVGVMAAVIGALLPQAADLEQVVFRARALQAVLEPGR